MAQSFLERHGSTIAASVSCFDRVIFKGYLKHLSHPAGMMRFLGREGVLLKHFDRFVSRHTQRLVQSAKARCAREGRSYMYLNSYHIDKDAKAREIAASQDIRDGLVCCFSVVERTNTFRMIGGKGAPNLVSAMRPCLCLYFYFIDPRFGFMHVRLASWFPFTVQIYLNGHQWLQRRLDAEGIDYELCDNYFRSVAEPERVQELSDSFVKLNFLHLLSGLAAEVNPLLADLLHGYCYYWVTDQAEYATDILFKDPADAHTIALFLEVMKGEHILGRFRNRTVARALYDPPHDPVHKRRNAARAARRIKKLHLHGYVARIPNTRAWTVTHKGYAVLGACVRAYHDDDIPQLIERQKAAS